MDSHECQGCAEYRELSRRQFMAVTGGAAVAFSAPAWLPRVVFAQDFCSDRDVMVCIFLRGAADGLTLCVPFTESAYYAARPTLAIPPPDSSDPNHAINLNGMFGFPPAMATLLPAYQAGHLLMVHACGSMDSSRSHFDAQRFMEIGQPGSQSLFTGWLGRHLVSAPPINPNALLRAIGMGYTLQQSLQGGPLTLPIPDLDLFGLAGNPGTVAARIAALHDMYELVEDPLHAAALTTQATIDLLNTIDFVNYQPAGGAVYPSGSVGYALKSTAALIKADLGVEAVAIDVGGWDTHNNQGPTVGTMANLMTGLSGGLAAFHADMFSGNGRNVTVVAMSEFGRRLAQNGNDGSDHGHGNAMLVLGNHIAGGRVLTQWPGLAPDQLFQGLDLQVTIDFRDILAEIVQQRLANNDLSFVFPDFTPTFRGVTQAIQPGDMNCDGDVNLADYAAVSACLSGPVTPAPANCARADADADSDVDLADIRAVQNAFGG